MSHTLLRPSGGLPIEVWMMIIHLLPRKSLQACLRVCHAWHDIAIAPLFSTVRLYFPWLRPPPESDISEGEQNPHAAEERALMKRLASDSPEILDCIINIPSFAKVIKRLIVNVLYAPTDHEKRHLIRAVEFLPRLSSFEWCGSAPSPELLSELLDTLAKCAHLTCLGFPYSGTGGKALNRSSQLPHQITCLKLAQPLEQSETVSTVFAYLSEVVLAPTLHTLELKCFSMQAAPTWQSFASLRELSLWNPVDVDSLLPVFRHTHSLESLALHCVGEEEVELLIALLADSTNVLPRLSYFVLTTGFLFSDEVHILHDFLVCRTAMKRLGLQFECSAEDATHVWPIIGGMKSLDALWLEVHSAEEIDLLSLVSVLPRSLRALVFYVPPGTELPEELHMCIDALPSLTTLCLPSHSFTRFSRFKTQTFGGIAPDERWSEWKMVTLDLDDFDDPDMGWFAPMIIMWEEPL